jgi:hypothetical protein
LADFVRKKVIRIGDNGLGIEELAVEVAEGVGADFEEIA